MRLWMLAALAAIGVTAEEASTTFFNGRDLSGWQAANADYWSVEEGAIVGKSGVPVPQNQFLWSEEKVTDFRLVLEVKLEPDSCNAGIQFRSRSVGGHAVGYQADVGRNVWGRLYHEHGRKKLDWRDRGEKAVKAGEWNYYEILAVGDRIWTAINGTLAVSVRDPQGERAGQIAFQVHSGPAQTVRYRNPRLFHNPEVRLAGMTEAELNAELVDLSRVATVTNANAAKYLVRPAIPPFADGFELTDGDVVAFVGGTNVDAQKDHGYLETMLTRAAGNKRVRFRNLGWQADTVYRQQRPRNFGSHRELLDRIDATIIIAAFGQAEALDGVGRVPEFVTAYRALLEQFAERTPRIVLVTPMPFQRVANPHQPDLTRHNAAVVRYGAAIAALGAELGYPVVGMAAGLPPGSTTDGWHLTRQGHLAAAREIASQLVGGDAAVFVEADQELRQAILKKNDLWFRHWRPTNWGFLYGNRQTQPSSRDHRDPSKRWFPAEIASILPLLDVADDAIATTSSGGR